MADANGNGVFFGVAVAEYDDGKWERLDGALAAMRDFGSLMQRYGFDARTLESPTRQQLVSEQQVLAELGKNGFEGPLVLVWTGHAEALGESLGLILRDTPARGSAKRDSAYRPGSLVSLLFETGSSNSLIVLDSCSAGAGDREMFLTTLHELAQSSFPGAPPGLACIASSRPDQNAEQGAFLTELLTLLRDGPDDPTEAGDFKIMWTPNSASVHLRAIFEVFKKPADPGAVGPDVWASGSCTIVFPTPNFNPQGGPAVLDDQLRSMAGKPKRGSLLIETPAMRTLSERAGDGSPGLWMLIGGPGTGKSTSLEHVHGELGSELMTLLPARIGLEALATEIAGSERPPAIAIDALDEAAVAEQAAIAELATGWARDRFVIVSSRLASAFGDQARTAAADLASRAAEVIDLDQASWRGDAIRRYVSERLGGSDDGD